jgi:hypothetical protein
MRTLPERKAAEIMVLLPAARSALVARALLPRDP